MYALGTVRKAWLNLQIMKKHINKSCFLPKYITMVFDVPIIFSFTDKFKEFSPPPAQNQMKEERKKKIWNEISQSEGQRKHIYGKI